MFGLTEMNERRLRYLPIGGLLGFLVLAEFFLIVDNDLILTLGSREVSLSLPLSAAWIAVCAVLRNTISHHSSYGKQPIVRDPYHNPLIVHADQHGYGCQPQHPAPEPNQDPEPAKHTTSGRARVLRLLTSLTTK